ncbi:MAG: CsbD family protein [Chloroflexi bacterium]|nr:MAG: CsbD family protein [Chloroflexota bacterium]
MDENILKGMWKQLKGTVKETWGELTDDDLTEVEGNVEKLAGKLQERYGWSRERADSEISHFIEKARTDSDIYRT